jgi:hypothetical protein
MPMTPREDRASLHSARAWALAALGLLLASSVRAGPAAGKPIAKSAARAQSEAEAAARGLVKECEEKPTSDGFLFQCGRTVVSVAEKAGAPAPLLDATLQLLRSLGGDQTFAELAVAVSGKQLPGQSFEIKRAGQDPIAGRVVAFSPRAGLSRAVLCFASRPSETSDYQCAKLIDALGAVGPAAFASRKPLPPPELFGRKLAVPDGCQAADSDSSAFRIVCGNSAALIVSLARDAKAAEQIVQQYRGEFLKQGRAAPDRDCTLSGATTRCQVVDGTGGTFYLASATVEKEAVIAICYQEPARVAAHPVCAQVLNF